MLTAYNVQAQQILAQHAKKEETYYCPVCREALILRQGSRKTPHFAHCRQSSSHEHLKGETIQHHQCKLSLYQNLREITPNVQLEPYLTRIAQIPDLIFKQWAIEIQFSPISVNRMRERSKGLRREGYQVLWITQKPRLKHGLYILSQLQQQCIVPSIRSLYCIDTTQFQLFTLNELIPITSTTFHGFLQRLSFDELEGHLNATTVLEGNIRKLSSAQILKYIQQCRRKNTVLDPTLSMMYQMRLTDVQVMKLTGFLFPEQLYIQTHPILWQLMMLKCLQANQPSHSLLFKQLKLRQFALEVMDKNYLINQIVQRYLKILNL